MFGRYSLKVKTLALTLSFLTILMVCLPIAMAIPLPPPTPPPPATLLWTDPVDVNDIALSKDGQYVAAVGPAAFSGELAFYSRSSGTPMWTWMYEGQGSLLSVAISYDGNCVAAGCTDGYVFFWNSARSRNPGDTDPTWTSDDLGGPIEYRSLDISNDGNYVVASGTGDSVYYWRDAKGISPGTINVATTWEYSFGYHFERVHAVDLSSDGNYVVAGTNYDAGQGYAAVAYWKNAKSLTGHPGDPPPRQDGPKPDWESEDPFADVVDVAVSDDGNYVASADVGSTVYYWANAKSRGPGETEHTWRSGHWPFLAIDISSDGDKVIAGGYDGVHFWGGARTLTGKPEDPSWSYPTASEVHDVAINDAGDYMAAANGFVTPYVYFFDNKGNSLWNPPYSPVDPVSSISISSDGGTLAIGTTGDHSRYLVSTGYRTPTKPVGGLAIPTDKLVILSPWIAVALAAVALAIFATKGRREL